MNPRENTASRQEIGRREDIGRGEGVVLRPGTSAGPGANLPRGERTSREQALYDEDLRLAAAVQRALMPVNVPRCECGRVFVRNRMCEQVGGDFCFLESLGQDQIAFAIGDAAGHGITAALIMSVTIGLLRSAEQDKRRPMRMVEAVNRLLIELGREVDMPITCSLLYGVVDLPSGILLYVNAGHPSPVIHRAGEKSCRHLPTTTLLLGIQSGVRAESCHQFYRHDRLVLYTDGIIEARDTREDQFGQKRLDALIRRYARAPAEELTQALFEAVDVFQAGPADDDQTVMVIDFAQVTASGG